MCRLPYFRGTDEKAVADRRLIHLRSCCFRVGTNFEASRQNLLKTAAIEDYAAEPPTTHREIETRLILSFLKEPHQAKISWQVTKTDVIYCDGDDPQPIMVWVSPVNVTARKTDGNYNETKTFYFAWKQGELFALALPEGTKNSYQDIPWTYLQ